MSQLATFAAGCFWGVEAKFSSLNGILETKVGYMGGFVREPSHEEVCNDTTGHAEVVQLSYDPEKISYDQLLTAFWQMHDPTTRNRQGPDTGSQYRSVIFYHDEKQKNEAELRKLALENSGAYSRPILTSISPANTFWRAEEQHQQYVAKHSPDDQDIL